MEEICVCGCVRVCGVISPEEAEDGDGDGESDERERVAHRIHGLHIGEVHVRAWGLHRETAKAPFNYPAQHLPSNKHWPGMDGCRVDNIKKKSDLKWGVQDSDLNTVFSPADYIRWTGCVRLQAAFGREISLRSACTSVSARACAAADLSDEE